MGYSTSERNKKRRHGANDSGELGFGTLVKHAARGALVSILSALLLSLAGSALLMLSPDPASLTLYTGIAIFFLSSAIGGAVSAIKIKHDKTGASVASLLCGFLIVVFWGFCSVIELFILPDSLHNLSAWITIAARLSAIPVSLVFGRICCKKRSSHHRRKR